MGTHRRVVVLLVRRPLRAFVAVPRGELVEIRDLAHLRLLDRASPDCTTAGGTVLPVSRRGDQLVITNRKARHDYHILDTWEAGIMLAGPEVKSIREGRANLQDSTPRIDDDELWLLGLHVLPYAYSREDLDPVRKRKLLLHRKEIVEIERALSRTGHDPRPAAGLLQGRASQVEIALARGKRDYDNARPSPSATPSARPSGP